MGLLWFETTQSNRLDSVGRKVYAEIPKNGIWKSGWNICLKHITKLSKIKKRFLPWFFKGEENSFVKHVNNVSVMWTFSNSPLKYRGHWYDLICVWVSSCYVKSNKAVCYLKTWASFLNNVSCLRMQSSHVSVMAAGRQEVGTGE